jgi:hypothetical protein
MTLLSLLTGFFFFYLYVFKFFKFYKFYKCFDLFLINRYDVRNLLDERKSFEKGEFEDEEEENPKLKEQLDSERYHDLFAIYDEEMEYKEMLEGLLFFNSRKI